jgi:hypothetical protein
MDPRGLERDFFRALNAFVEPAVRAGLGAPGFVPYGLVVLEITGRTSGRTYRTPLLASLVDGCLIVGTFRRRSQWVQNVRAQPSITGWLHGREFRGHAYVLTPGDAAPLPRELSQLVRALAENVLPRYTAHGWSFAVIRLLPGNDEPAAP